MKQGVKTKVSGLIAALCKGLYEREEAVKLALLSAVAGESIFLLGPPGVGKSLVARRLKFAFADGKAFEYLMTKFSTPDEVFGPVSIKKLKDEDKYERQTERYLPGANLVFLDEIWKSSSAIQNALLTILNEKVYRNGEQELDVNLHAIITASNELPPMGESFEPLWDRMLIRYQMLGISKPMNFLRMITATDDVYDPQVPIDLQITAPELQSWQIAIDLIEVPEEVLNAIQIIRYKLEDYNQKQSANATMYTYDRRWKKIVRLLRTSAFLNERNKVDLMDVFLMVHCLWNKPNQIDAVKQIVAETVRDHGYSLSINLNVVRRQLEDLEEEVEQEIQVKHKKAVGVLTAFNDEYYQLQKDHEKFAGNFIEIKAFNQLEINQKQVVNLYDSEYKLVNRLDACKGQSPHTVVVRHNAVDYTLTLVQHQTEKTEFISKKPHPLLVKHWDKLYTEMMQYLKEQLQFIEANTPKELEEAAFNLFIESKLSLLVKANLNEVKNTLEDLKLRLEKTKYSYDHA